ncbi:MAG: hypothetical protein QGH45_15835 [Myxococcota bacterium]|nr:hypothetical protein [Myxococcota bacterium]
MTTSRPRGGGRWLALLAVLALIAPGAADAKKRRQGEDPNDRGAELRAVGDVAESLDSLFVPVDGALTLSSDSARYDPLTGSIEAEGDVKLSFGAWTLRCQHVSLDLEAQTAEASGDAELVQGETRIRFASAVVELDTLEGMIVDAEVQGAADRYQFHAGALRRMRDGQVFVRETWFTPCGCGDRKPAWSVESRFVRITPEGIVQHRRSWFRLGNKRVLPIPAGRFDAVTGRASGLMLPEIRLGGTQPFSVGLPLYLTLGRNMDLTLTPAYYDTRGFMGSGELRYAMAPGQGGTLSISAIHDRSLLETVRERSMEVIPDVKAEGYSELRFWGQWRHLQRDRHAMFGAHLDVVRDDMILKDFEQDYAVRRTPYLASNLWGGVHDKRVALRLETEIVDDMSDVRNSAALHSLPRLRASATRLRARPGTDWRVGLDLDSDLLWAVSFPGAWTGNMEYQEPYSDVGRDGLFRGHAAYVGRDDDGSEGSTRYEAGEPVHRTLRAGARARFGATWTPGGWLWVKPWAEVRGSLYGGYRHHEDPGQLGTLRAGTEVGTALFRDFRSVRHVIEPTVAYEMQPVVTDTVHPILTYDDLQQPYHRVKLELVNRWQQGTRDTFLRTMPRIQALELRAATAIELVEDARFDSELPIEPLRMELSYRHRHGRLGARTIVAWEKEPFQLAGAQASLDHPNGNRLSLAYDWVRGGKNLLWSAGAWYPLLHGGLPDTGIHEVAFGVTWVPYTFLKEAVADPKRILRGFELGGSWRVNLRGEMGPAQSRVLNHEYWLTFTSPCACWRAGVDLRFASDWNSPSFGIRADLITK